MGLTHLLLALVLEASVNEVQSLVVVVLMVRVATFMQHMDNIMCSLQDMVLHNESEKQSATAGEQHVSSLMFRFLNEGDACQVYLGFAFIFIAVYWIISPRESQADPEMSVFVLTLFFFDAVSALFNIFHEVKTKMTKTMWITKHEVEKTKNYVMRFLLFMLTIQSAAAHYEY